MDQRRKDYRREYIKNFVHNQEYKGPPSVKCKEDIPVESESYRNVLYFSFAYLSSMTSQDMSKLRILPMYLKLLRRNDLEMQGSTNPIKFALILYILHRYCVRIQRSPWRKDFLTIKAYTGFHQYTFRQWISPTIIMELFAMIDFIYNPNLDSFIYSNHDSPDFYNIKESGMEFFLSYTHCMAKNDSQFKKTIRAPRPLPNPTRSVSPMAAVQSTSSLEISGPSGLSRNSVRLAALHPSSSSREKQRDRRRPEPQEERSMYEGAHSTGSLYMKSFPHQYDIYNPQEAPMDLSRKISPVKQNQNNHGHLTNHGSPDSDYDDLYGGADSRGPYNGSHELVPSLENSITGKVLYPPNASPGQGLDMQMENCSFEPTRNNYVKETASNSKKHSDPLISNNYVKVSPLKGRGTPDGQTTQDNRDPLANWHNGRSANKNPTQRTQGRRHEHVYCEIDDNDMYGP